MPEITHQIRAEVKPCGAEIDALNARGLSLEQVTESALAQGIEYCQTDRTDIDPQCAMRVEDRPLELHFPIRANFACRADVCAKPDACMFAAQKLSSRVAEVLQGYTRFMQS